MEFFIILGLTLINGFFALSEIALVSARKSGLEQKAARGHLGAKAALKLTANPQQFLSAVQVGITLISIVQGVYGGEVVAGYLAPWLEKAGLETGTAFTLAMGSSIIIITYLSIVLGELIPKSYALQHADSLALTVSPILDVFSRITYPFVKLLTISTQLVLRLFGIRNVSNEQITEEELKAMIRTARQQGVMERDEEFLHENVFRFSDKKAYSLMTHRNDVVAIDLNRSKQEIAATLHQHNHSYYPVYDRNKDVMKGILSAREFFMQPQKSLQELIKPAIFVPDSMLAWSVMQRFKKEKKHFGIVINEYGSFEGIITIHDITEGVFGNIPDAGEEGEGEYMVLREDGSWLADGATPIDELQVRLDWEWIRHYPGNYVTLSGVLMEYLQHIPKAGEVIDLQGIRLEILDMDGVRIDKVLISATAE
jgi:putative hemolysin